MQHAVRTNFENETPAQPRMESLCLAVVYVKGEGGSEAPVQKLINAVRRQPGVQRAEHGSSRANIVTVQYDRSMTIGSRIVQSLRQAGYHAMLVGC